MSTGFVPINIPRGPGQFGTPIGGGGQDPKKPNPTKPGRSHEEERLDAEKKRARDEKKKKQEKKQQRRQQATPQKTRDDADSDVEILERAPTPPRPRPMPMPPLKAGATAVAAPAARAVVKPETTNDEPKMLSSQTRNSKLISLSQDRH